MVKGCGNECMKFILFLFNFSFVALGICLMGLGGYILSQVGKWEEVVDAPDAAAILVIAVGAVTFFVAFLGCCGASSESACMLNTYAVIVGLVFIVEIAAAILMLVYTQDITALVKTGTQKAFDKYGSKANPIDGVVDFIQSSFECCGTYGKNYWYTRSGYTDKLPSSCCIKTVDFAKGRDISCGERGVPGTGIPWESGCTKSMDDFLRLFTSLIAGVFIFAAAIKSVAACFACALSNAVTY